jgi:hypothetical protein
MPEIHSENCINKAVLCPVMVAILSMKKFLIFNVLDGEVKTYLGVRSTDCEDDFPVEFEAISNIAHFLYFLVLLRWQMTSHFITIDRIILLLNTL